ncbi:M14 family metallopeptidase [Rhodohalobacter barkolensis]|uniref:Zinc carboxypeptidase n=1 Tax=Rhodohalobacter barkolensis TaxID=2053187 RepID=A0A2N0VET6_9BACT|nr:M14 family metallopeptidase [Rhodohalobacter barkolensis]PKD42711.1 zinc carboxypeptidase [Rhodohalobacter barkolensis]
MKSLLQSILLLLIVPAVAFSQVELEYYLPDGVTYNPDIPTPKEVVGHEVGEWHITHDKLVQYMYALAEASDRVTIQEYARTYENRPLLVLTITAPDNHSSIDQIKSNQSLLRNPERSGNLDLESMPVIVNMGFSVHGNEASGSNASLVSAYHFAAAQGDEIEETLSNTVILLDPSFNPDGLQRFSTWVNMHKSATTATDPAAREFGEVWPGGRTNHYWFDLNRDWMPVVHPESRGRIKMYQEWKPHVLTDHHEMGTNSTFFFQPGIPSRTHPLTPQRNQDLTAAIGEYHADELDEIQSLYYTRESFDDFYYGKGSTYPDIFGTIGILFEQASSRGHAQESDHGVVEFPFAVRNQFRTSLSTVKAANGLRMELHNNMREFYREVQQEASRSSVKAFVIGDTYDSGKNYHFADLMSRHNVEIYELAQNLEVDGKSFEQGKAWVIPVEQTEYKFIEAMFERRTEFTDSLFYDVSTWTLPSAFNLPHVELNQRQFDSNLMGDRVESPEKPSGQIIGGRSNYAYAFEWDEYYAPRALYRLQELGVRTQAAFQKFQSVVSTGAKEFNYGTIVVPLGIQDVDEATIFRTMQEIAEEDGVDVYNLRTGLAASGVDLGSPNVNALEKPSIAILVGSGVSNLEAGEVWHQLDQRYKIPITLLEKDRVGRTDLSRYNRLVLVNGGYGDLSESAKADLKSWVRDGGTLIVQKSAVNWAISEGLLNAERVEQESSDNRRVAYEDLSAARGAQGIGGSIFEANLDNTNPLMFGYRNDSMHIFRNSTTFLQITENQAATPLYLTDNPLVSGYISGENSELIKNTASIMVGSYGSGRVIGFVDNPNFRAFWFGTNKLFANALFFGDQISRTATN